MNIYQQRAIALIETIRELTAQGYECYTAMKEYSAVDLIATKENKTYRLRVKYRLSHNSIITVRLRSLVRSVLCGPTTEFDSIDGWAVFCPELNSVVFVKKSEVDLSARNFSFALNEGNTNTKLYSEHKNIEEWQTT
jgi:hypothetical protein